jgi:calcineurin-like phosphoesterase
LKKFTTGIGQRFETAHGGVQLEGALVELDASTGAATAIEAIRVPLASPNE